MPGHEQSRYTSSEALLRLREVAERLSISESTVRRLISEGTLRSTRIGGSVRVRIEDMAALIERGLHQEAEEPASRPALRDHADAGGGHDRG